MNSDCLDQIDLSHDGDGNRSPLENVVALMTASLREALALQTLGRPRRERKAPRIGPEYGIWPCNELPEEKVTSRSRHALIELTRGAAVIPPSREGDDFVRGADRHQWCTGVEYFVQVWRSRWK